MYTVRKFSLPAFMYFYAYLPTLLVEDMVRSVADDRSGKIIYADDIRLAKGKKKRKTPGSSLDKAGLQILAVDRTDLYERLQQIGVDNIITPLEKRSLEREWKSLLSSKNQTMQSVTQYGVEEQSLALAMFDAFDELEEFIAIVLDPLHIEENTNISELGNLTELFEHYYNAKTALDEMLFRLETGMLSGLDYRTKYQVAVTGSNGVVVPEDGSFVTLSVALFQEGIEVTDEFEGTDFTWSRVTEDRASDAAWRLNSNTGKSISINTDDLVYKAGTFLCTFKHLYSDTMYFEKVGMIALSEEVAGKDAISVQIFSTNGNVFREGECYTTMNAIVWRGDTNITDELDASLFNWERTSGDSIADESWNTSSKAIGRKSTELTPLDVLGRSVFACHVDI